MKESETWVTLIQSDKEAWGALVLAASIRKTQTSKKLSAVVSEDVSPQMKCLLNDFFDSIRSFHTNDVGGKRKGKLSLWNSNSWTKCVYLDPFSWIQWNADTLFLKPSFSACMSSTGNEFDTSLFVFRPDVQTFEKLMDLSKKSKGDSDSILNGYFKVQAGSTSHIAESFIEKLEHDTSKKLNGHTKAKIITFPEAPWGRSEALSGNSNHQHRQWMATFESEVVPRLEQLKNSSCKQFLKYSMAHYKLQDSANKGENLHSSQYDAALENSIAVVGMSCRFPGANNADEFWDLLISGRDPIRAFPEERHMTEEMKKAPNFEAGFLNCPIDTFDAKFFGISPREALFMDPQQRLLLEVIWESLENANINPQELKGSDTGVYVGLWEQEYQRLIATGALSPNESLHRYLGNAFSATASRISYFLGLHGANFGVECGCSSSAGAVHLACQSIWSGETSMAIAGGVNLVLTQYGNFGFGRNSIVHSNDFRCKTFDESANGFVRAEGCAAIILKPFLNAIRDGDNVLGVIRGTALNNDGTGPSFGTPNTVAHQLVFRQALSNARVEPEEVSLVEAHGTGTFVGDPIEMNSIGQVYGGRKDPLLVSSVKSNIGHAEACAGLAGVIKVLLCLKHKKVPPHLHLKKLNPKIDLDSIPAKIPVSVTEWDAAKRIAAVCSFSMSGTNVHVIVQETPQISRLTNSNTSRARPLEMVGISAKSEEALESLRKSYITFLEKNTTFSLTDIAYTLNVGRANMPYRIGLTATDTTQLLNKLNKRTYITGKVSGRAENIIFLFTGQGSQYFGMAKTLYEFSSVFKESLDEIDVLFKQHLNVSLHDVLWKDPNMLTRTIYGQPALFSVQYCLSQVWASFGIRPNYVLGHSVGEYCAAVCSGILSLEDAMKLIVGRSKLLDSVPAGKMMAVKVSPVQTRRLIKEFTLQNRETWIDVAAENSSTEVIVSGSTETISKFEEFCKQGGIKVQTINSSHAFHSRHMDTIVEEFGRLASTVRIGKLNCGYISSTFARELTNEEFEPSYWQKHLRNTVRFQEAIKFVWDTLKSRILVEVGTQPVLLGLAMANSTDSTIGVFCPSLRKNEDDLSSIFNSMTKLYVTGVDISWGKFYEGAQKLSLPTYPFERQQFWYESVDNSIKVPPTIHALVGRKLPVPLNDQFFTSILGTKEIPYLADHKVAERIILPAAAYLETMMVAGCHVLQGGRGEVPCIIEDMVVEGAMELATPTQVQTVVRLVDRDEGVKFEIGIHRQVSADDWDEWKRHAVATFSSSLGYSPSENTDLKSLMERLTPTEKISDAYENIANAGIQFGPKFKSIIRAWEGDRELLTQVTIPDDSNGYMCHPIILDAMIQTFVLRSALTKDNAKLKLQLPVGIKKFTWLCKEISSQVFVHTTWIDSTDSTVTLYNENSETLAVMEGLEVFPTTTDHFLRLLDTEAKQLPDFYEEIWNPANGVSHARLDPYKFSYEPSTYMKPLLDKGSKETKQVSRHLALIDSLVFQYFLRALKESQWPWPKIGAGIMSADWAKVAPPDLRIVKTEALMELMLDNDYLKSAGNGLYKIQKDLPSLEELETKIGETLKACRELAGEEDICNLFVERCGLHLPSLLQGKISSINYLFPSEPNEVGANRLYTEDTYVSNQSEFVAYFVLDAIISQFATNKGVARILEVGAGSGIICQTISQALKSRDIPFQYTFTDISPAFFLDGSKRFGKEVRFQVFDIEEDPLSQGFAPAEYDFVLAANVIHATASIAESLGNLKKVLRPGGLLILGELLMTSPIITLSFGFLDGWFRFNDDRKKSPLLDADQWTNALEKAGYTDAKSFLLFHLKGGGIVGRRPHEVSLPISNELKLNKSWLFVSDGTQLETLLRDKMTEFGRQVVYSSSECRIPKELEGIIYFWSKSNSSDFMQLKHLLEFSQAVISEYQEAKTKKPKFIIVTRGVYYLGDAGPGNPNAATAESFLRVFTNENMDFPTCLIDVDQDESNPTREASEVFAQLWLKDKEMFKAIREDKVFSSRLVPLNSVKDPIPFPNSTRFHVPNPPSKSLSALEIVVASKIEPVGSQVEIAVRATALNFRDIFLILQPEGIELPDEMKVNAGLDIAGIVSAVGPDCKRVKVGDEVFGFGTGGFASHAILPEQSLLPKPAGMTFAAAATMAVPFMTVFYAFSHCAKLKAGDRVLIHVATGGVGLAAIQVAKHLGAEIYATAGSRRKRAYLRSLGIKYIYHSRNTDFGDEILKDTRGAGVDVLLNSLTGPNFKEASLRACAKGARFVEIGKLNIWTEDEVKALRPDVKYFTVDLLSLGYTQPDEMKRHLDCLRSELEKDIYKGLPHECFPLDLIREAFYFFQKAKHIGKIVITIPETKVSLQGRISFHHHIFNAESTYLITGGLRGIGLEVAKWMLSKGAQNIILAGRSVPTRKSDGIIQSMNNANCRVMVFQADVGKFDDCSALLRSIPKLGFPPLRGIMHAAGVLSDAIIPNQTWEKFETVLRPKIHGTLNLHQLTLGTDLEFFTFFSSASAIFGSAGQSNHAAANRFMDSFAYMRHSMGLPATTMNFGSWADVGVVETYLIAGILAYMKHFSAKQGIASIEQVFRERRLQSVICDFRDRNKVTEYLHIGHYLDHLKSETSTSENAVQEYAAMFDEILTSAPSEQHAKYEDLIERMLKETLRIPDNENVDRNQAFSEIGVDSLMVMELKNKLQLLMGEKQLTASSLSENNTISKLAFHIQNLMGEEEGSMLDCAALATKDAVLPPEIEAASVPACKPSEIREVLLTGSTGHLGVHFIKEIQCENPGIRIHCLVRGRDTAEAKKKLQKTLTLYSLSDKVNMDMVSVIPGDTAKENFGLPFEQYEKLSGTVDAIVHCAVKANHVEDYGFGESSVRVNNVRSSLNVLEFAGRVRTKRVLYASSLVAVSTANEDGTLKEEFPKEDDTDGFQLQNGYCLSKFVCEKLMQQATARGIPVTVFRYASLFGSSLTGFMPSEKDHIWAVVLSCMRFKHFPKVFTDGWPIMSVDIAARISTCIFFRDMKEEGVYNLTSDSVMSTDQILQVFSKFGLNVEAVPLSEWVDLVFDESDSQDNPLRLFKDIYKDREGNLKITSWHPFAKNTDALRMCNLSEKVKRNLNEVEKMVVPLQSLLELHLKNHYEKVTMQG